MYTYKGVKEGKRGGVKGADQRGSNVKRIRNTYTYRGA